MSLVRVGDSKLLQKEETKLQKFNLRNQKLIQKSRPVPPLKIGNYVKLYCQKTKSFSRNARVIAFGKTKYSYLLEDDNGSQFYRNRRHCKIFNPSQNNCIDFEILTKNCNHFKHKAENDGGDVYCRSLYDIHFPPLKGCVPTSGTIAFVMKSAVAPAA